MASCDDAATLVATIQENQRILDTRVQALSTTGPSFSSGISRVLMVDKEAALARNAIADASEELSALMRGPQGILTHVPHNVWTPLHVIARFDLATAIPTDGDQGRTFQEIADARSLDVSTVKRIIKNAIALHVFTEGPPGVVRHNAASRYLAQTPEMQQWIRMTMEELWPAATKVADAIEKYPGSQEPHESPYALAHDTNAGFFGFMSQNPERFKRFADAMTWFSSGPGLEASHLADGYPWGEMPANAKVVDVGGSFGAVSMAVAKKYPSISFVVQDRPEVVEAGRAQLPPEFADRFRFEAHDFFTEQPVQDADIFLLRQIFHDWSDKYAAQILRSLLPALEKSQGRIVIMEQIVPETGQVSKSTERKIRSFDIAMLEISNGKERDMSDWRELFAAVDSRLQLTRTFQPSGSRMGLLEVRLQSNP